MDDCACLRRPARSICPLIRLLTSSSYFCPPSGLPASICWRICWTKLVLAPRLRNAAARSALVVVVFGELGGAAVTTGALGIVFVTFVSPKVRDVILLRGKVTLPRTSL